MDDVLAAGLHSGLVERLDYLDRLAAHGDDTTRTMVLDTRLTAPLRDLIKDHQPDARGRCPLCRPRWRRGRTPSYRVWATAHRQLIALEPAAPPTGAARHATPVDHTAGAPSAGC
ncbi:hypothetical protein [Saccharothrix xinjiangensis]|uniref:Uncharacterized protein n=1 Tax=Saccharothrix xinjiangensis TaxID=204798 RepID=A0ABV9XYM3_9PSEU